MHHARLHDREWPDPRNGLRQALQSVATHEACVHDAAIPQFSEHIDPLLCPFPPVVPTHKSKNVATTVEVDPHRHVDRPVRDLPLADLEHDRVDDDHRIHPAVSSGRRESDSDELSSPSSHELRRGPVVEASAWWVVELVGHFSKPDIGDEAEVRTFRRSTAGAAHWCFRWFRAARASAVSEVDAPAGRCFDAFVVKHLVALVPSQRAAQRRRELGVGSGQGVADDLSAVVAADR